MSGLAASIWKSDVDSNVFTFGACVECISVDITTHRESALNALLLQLVVLETTLEQEGLTSFHSSRLMSVLLYIEFSTLTNITLASCSLKLLKLASSGH